MIKIAETGDEHGRIKIAIETPKADFAIVYLTPSAALRLMLALADYHAAKATPEIECPDAIA